MHLHPPEQGAEDFGGLFAIFFPAVTGFTAGVNMSGDLRDPKRSIPVGTMAAIGVGLVVYVTLAIYLAWRVPADQLAGDPNVLVSRAAIPLAVVGGIWGATLSSGLGSILGAPRILQAMSSDRVTPTFFAKGHGKGNEPRRALVVAFAIGEAGILIGELNAIARLVSIFFIAIYGFLNLSCAIESWASTDFRPEFRIPRWVSAIGALTCFGLMIQLDPWATVGGQRDLRVALRLPQAPRARARVRRHLGGGLVVDGPVGPRSTPARRRRGPAELAAERDRVELAGPRGSRCRCSASAPS